jgi:hypothetical protein
MKSDFPSLLTYTRERQHFAHHSKAGDAPEHLQRMIEGNAPSGEDGSWLPLNRSLSLLRSPIEEAISA